MILVHNNPCTVLEHVTRHNGAKGTSHDDFKDLEMRNQANYYKPA